MGKWMSFKIINENTIEQEALKCFEELDYTKLYGSNIAPKMTQTQNEPTTNKIGRSKIFKI